MFAEHRREIAAFGEQIEFEIQPETADVAVAGTEKRPLIVHEHGLGMGKDLAPLERVKLGDTVYVSYRKLGVTVKKKVTETVYNVLADRYDSMDTDALAKMDMGVNWERCYHDREEIRTKFQEAVTLSK